MPSLARTTHAHERSTASITFWPSKTAKIIARSTVTSKIYYCYAVLREAPSGTIEKFQRAKVERPGTRFRTVAHPGQRRSVASETSLVAGGKEHRLQDGGIDLQDKDVVSIVPGFSDPTQTVRDHERRFSRWRLDRASQTHNLEGVCLIDNTASFNHCLKTLLSFTSAVNLRPQTSTSQTVVQ